MGGVELQVNAISILSPETYVGYDRAEHFVSTGGQVHDKAHVYAAPSACALNDWGLVGNWKVGLEQATLVGGTGRKYGSSGFHKLCGRARKITIDWRLGK
jgi:hypothetical protein